MTRYDRLGPDGPAIVRAVVLAALFSPLGGIAGAALAMKRGASPNEIGWAGLFGMLAGGYLLFLIMRRIPEAGGSAMQATLMPSGNSTPYETDFSYEMAMAMRGDTRGALASFEEKLAAENPTAALRLKAAELFVSSGNPERARDLYREVQKMQGVAARDDVFASYRLIDLYRGKLSEPGKSLPEFRRLIERYPDTDIAQRAREALANLKKEMAFD